MLARRVNEQILLSGGEELARVLRKTLEGADAVCGNLECPLTVKAKRRGAFQGRLESAALLSDFQVLSLANNHMFDCGDEGISETHATLEARSIVHTGVASSELGAFEVKVISVCGARIGYLGCCVDELIGRPSRSRYYMAALKNARLDEVLKLAREKTDYLCVMVHGGNEFVPYPPPSFRRRILELLCWADVVVTHHPHVLGGSEIDCHGRLAWYGLGDFVFDSCVSLRRQTGVLLVRLSLQRREVLGFKLKPLWIGDDGMPRVATVETRTRIMSRVERMSRRLRGRRYDRFYLLHYLVSLTHFQVQRLIDELRSQGAGAMLCSMTRRFKLLPHYLRFLIGGRHR
jgi:poly-gamma-glutamate capsule biosynthesis protein CapA/YwtB (metallophosphatase superfamily)